MFYAALSLEHAGPILCTPCATCPAAVDPPLPGAGQQFVGGLWLIGSGATGVDVSCCGDNGTHAIPDPHTISNANTKAGAANPDPRAPQHCSRSS